jgi:hypothetical protein
MILIMDDAMRNNLFICRKRAKSFKKYRRDRKLSIQVRIKILIKYCYFQIDVITLESEIALSFI